MCESDEKRTSDFLKYAIDRLESSIRLVDNKASILIVVIAGLTAALTFLFEKVVWAHLDDGLIRTVSYCVFAGMLLSLLVVLFLLLWTVRPDRSILGTKAGLVPYKKNVYSLLWPPRDFLRHAYEQADGERKYAKAMQELPQMTRADFEQTHFALFQLLSRKQRHYRFAIWLLKLWVLFLGLVISIATWRSLT